MGEAYLFKTEALCARLSASCQQHLVHIMYMIGLALLGLTPDSQLAIVLLLKLGGGNVKLQLHALMLVLLSSM